MSRQQRDRILALDKERVWHPYTEMGRYRAEVDPLVVVGAEGARLTDADGRVYLDGNSSWWTAALGHNHPRVIRAIKEQVERLAYAHTGFFTSEPAERLADRLVGRDPSARQLADTGGEQARPGAVDGLADRFRPVTAADVGPGPVGGSGCARHPVE